MLGTSSLEIKILFHTQLHNRGNCHTCAVASVSFSTDLPYLSTIAGVSLVWQDWCLQYTGITQLLFSAHCGDVCLFMQEFLVAVGVRGATLQHRVVPPSLSWYDQVGQDGANTSLIFDKLLIPFNQINVQRPCKGNITYLQSSFEFMCNRLLTFWMFPMSLCWVMPLLHLSPPYIYTCGAAL